MLFYGTNRVKRLKWFTKQLQTACSEMINAIRTIAKYQLQVEQEDSIKAFSVL